MVPTRRTLDGWLYQFDEWIHGIDRQPLRQQQMLTYLGIHYYSLLHSLAVLRTLNVVHGAWCIRVKQRKPQEKSKTKIGLRWYFGCGYSMIMGATVVPHKRTHTHTSLRAINWIAVERFSSSHRSRWTTTSESCDNSASTITYSQPHPRRRCTLYIIRRFQRQFTTQNTSTAIGISSVPHMMRSEMNWETVNCFFWLAVLGVCILAMDYSIDTLLMSNEFLVPANLNGQDGDFECVNARIRKQNLPFIY